MQDHIALQDETQPNGTPKPAKVKRGNPERMAADRALYAQLQHDEFVGRRMEQLREDLWVYGWKVLRAWMKDGTLIQKCGERNIPVSAHWKEVDLLQRRGDLRDEIAHESVQRALKAFTEEALPSGQWKPDKGATMRTYFTVSCMIAFREVFKKWLRGYRRHLAVTADGILNTDRPDRGLSPDDAVIYKWTIQRILRDATLEARAICSLIYEQKRTQKDIGEELGMTSRQVEGHMRRLRTHADLMTSQGEIADLYGRIAAAKADAQ